MAIFSLHIGINKIDPDHYRGWNGELHCCENDAIYYYGLAKTSGVSQSSLLLSSSEDPASYPTSENLMRLLEDYAKNLRENDLLFITYSGHGGNIPDQNYDEDDGQDETWCLYDRQFLDDELNRLFSRFQKGVRIFLISDSCHSGTIAKAIDDEDEIISKQKTGDMLLRVAPKSVTYGAYKAHRDIYLEATKGPIIEVGDIAATVLQFGACRDNERAAEMNGYGVFTSIFRKLMESGKEYSYQQLFDAVASEMPQDQHPELFAYGENTDAFLKEECFLHV